MVGTVSQQVLPREDVWKPGVMEGFTSEPSELLHVALVHGWVRDGLGMRQDNPHPHPHPLLQMTVTWLPSSRFRHWRGVPSSPQFQTAPPQNAP